MVERIGVEQAADVLRVSARQVRALASAGELPAERLGSIWLLDADAVRARARQAPSAGRPLSPVVAWSVLHVLDELLANGGGDVTSVVLDRQLRHRIRLLLSQPRPADRWRQALRRRADRRPVWVHPGVLPRVAADLRLSVGGSAAAARHAVEAADPVPRRWYVAADVYEDVLSDYRMDVVQDGAHELLVIPADVPAGLRPRPGGPVRLAAALADMLDSADARERHAAGRRLEPLHLPRAP